MPGICKHDWVTHPLPQAEFKCRNCGALGHWVEGYKILPYFCQRCSCGELAIDVVDAVRLCIEHRNQEKRLRTGGFP